MSADPHRAKKWRLVVVLPLLPLPVGAGYPLNEWPLHVTVVPTFVIGADPVAVAAALESVLDGQPVLAVVAGPDEGFGPRLNVPVTVVEPSAELTALHRRLAGAVLAQGAVFDEPQFTGAGYRAHITITNGNRVSAGDRLTLLQAALVDMEPEGSERLRRIVWTAALSGR